MVPAPTKSTPSSSGSRTSPAAREQGKKSRITVPFRRSPALRPSRRDISIQTSIKYVVSICLLLELLISYLLVPVPRAGQSGEYIHLSHKTISDIDFSPLGRWCRLWSRLDFVDQPLKNCVNILHVDIVNIWEQYDGDNVSSPQLHSCFVCSAESVSIQRPIQNKNVSRRQRFSFVG